jgi:hypothetical protein
VVNSIDSASIAPAGTNAVVTIAGHVTAWVCGHPLGATVKTIAASDSVTLTATVQIIVIDQKQIGLRLKSTGAAGLFDELPFGRILADLMAARQPFPTSTTITAATGAPRCSASRARISCSERDQIRDLPTVVQQKDRDLDDHHCIGNLVRLRYAPAG